MPITRGPLLGLRPAIERTQRAPVDARSTLSTDVLARVWRMKVTRSVAARIRESELVSAPPYYLIKPSSQHEETFLIMYTCSQLFEFGNLVSCRTKEPHCEIHEDNKRPSSVFPPMRDPYSCFAKASATNQPKSASRIPLREHLNTGSK